MTSKFVNHLFFTKEKAEYLKKIRVIKTNLIHIHGFPKCIARCDLLKKKEYFGQYGTIEKIMITKKQNPDTKGETYSCYITYSNEREAATAILCVDSLLIQGKIVRAFFGTNKYCNHFLNNNSCPNKERCLFLHKLTTEQDIIIDSNKVFSYDEHLNLSKKIINFYFQDIKNILEKTEKQKGGVLPWIDFLFLSEQEKQSYFYAGDISYFNSAYKEPEYNLNNKISNNKNLYISRNNNYNYFCNNSFNKNCESIFVKNFVRNNVNNASCDITNGQSPTNAENANNLHKIFYNVINHILLTKPFFINFKNIPLKKLEINYLKDDLTKKGYDLDVLLKGCKDCLIDLNI